MLLRLALVWTLYAVLCAAYQAPAASYAPAGEDMVNILGPLIPYEKFVEGDAIEPVLYGQYTITENVSPFIPLNPYTEGFLNGIGAYQSPAIGYNPPNLSPVQYKPATPIYDQSSADYGGGPNYAPASYAPATGPAPSYANGGAGYAPLAPPAYSSAPKSEIIYGLNYEHNEQPIFVPSYPPITLPHSGYLPVASGYDAPAPYAPAPPPAYPGPALSGYAPPPNAYAAPAPLAPSYAAPPPAAPHGGYFAAAPPSLGYKPASYMPTIPTAPTAAYPEKPVASKALNETDAKKGSEHPRKTDSKPPASPPVSNETPLAKAPPAGPSPAPTEKPAPAKASSSPAQPPATAQKAPSETKKTSSPQAKSIPQPLQNRPVIGYRYLLRRRSAPTNNQATTNYQQAYRNVNSPPPTPSPLSQSSNKTAPAPDFFKRTNPGIQPQVRAAKETKHVPIAGTNVNSRGAGYSANGAYGNGHAPVGAYPPVTVYNENNVAEAIVRGYSTTVEDNNNKGMIRIFEEAPYALYLDMRICNLKKDHIYSIYIHDYGQLSAGCESTGAPFGHKDTYFNPMMGVRSNPAGFIVSFRYNGTPVNIQHFAKNLYLKDLCGRSIVVHEVIVNPEMLPEALQDNMINTFTMMLNPLSNPLVQSKKVACGVIGRANPYTFLRPPNQQCEIEVPVVEERPAMPPPERKRDQKDDELKIDLKKESSSSKQ